MTETEQRIADTVLAYTRAEPGVWSVGSLAADLGIHYDRMAKIVEMLRARGVSPALRAAADKRAEHRAKAARRLFEEGASVRSIAFALGVVDETVRGYLGDLNEGVLEDLLPLLNEAPGLSVAEYAAYLKLPVARVSRELKARGLHDRVADSLGSV